MWNWWDNFSRVLDILQEITVVMARVRDSTYCLIEVRLVVQHEEVHDLEGPGGEPVIVPPQWSIVQDGVLCSEVCVDCGDPILLSGLRLEEVSDLLKTQRVDSVSNTFIEGRVIHTVVRKHIVAILGQAIIWLVIRDLIPFNALLLILSVWESVG